MNNRKTGTEWEIQAADYLTRNGMRIIEKNFRCRQGEIDLIGYHEGYLVFVEVKYRSSYGSGHALEAVDYRKQCKICKAADYYRYSRHLGTDIGVRYDVIGIQNGKIEWIQNAFPHVYRC